MLSGGRRKQALLGDAMEAVILSGDDGVVVVEIRVEGVDQIDVDYEVAGGGRISGPTPVLKITVREKETPGVDGKIWFIGLQEDLDIYVDPVNWVPLQMTGKVPVVGSGTVKLKGVTMR